MQKKIDVFDLKIIQALMEDGRCSHEKIAGSLDISRPTVHNRVNELCKAGIIKRYTAVIDWEKLGYGIDAFIMLRLETRDFNQTIKNIMLASNAALIIEKAYRVTGENCIILRIHARNTSEIRNLHDMLLQSEGIIETNTMFILQEESQIPQFRVWET